MQGKLSRIIWSASYGKPLSESEKYLWSFIDDNIRKIPDYSVVRLSARANVSTATIVRAMKKKGDGGFTAFKHSLKERSHLSIDFSGIDRIDDEIKRAI